MRLTLSHDQMVAHVRRDADFAHWYAENFMKTHLPQFYWSVSPEGRNEMVINGRRYAQYFGIADIPSQMHFVTLMWTIGANFFVFDAFRKIAVDRDLSGPQKIDAFYAVDPDLACDALMNPDDRYWYPEMVGLEDTLK